MHLVHIRRSAGYWSMNRVYFPSINLSMYMKTVWACVLPARIGPYFL